MTNNEKIAEIRKKLEYGRIVKVQVNTVYELMADIRFLLSELESAAYGNDCPNGMCDI